MGLDQYLTARKFVGGYDHSSAESKEMFNSIVGSVGLQGLHDNRFATVNVNVAYWRKANHIHHWFVQNAQDGVDDCKEYEVSRDKLAELQALCERVIKSGDPKYAAENLPTADGFFFGSDDYDEYYIQDTDETAKRLALILEETKDLTGFEAFEFYYQASW